MGIRQLPLPRHIAIVLGFVLLIPSLSKVEVVTAIKVASDSASDAVEERVVAKTLLQLHKTLLADKGNKEAIFRVMLILDDRGMKRIKAKNRKGGYGDMITAGTFARQIAKSKSALLLPKKERAWVGNALYNEACALPLCQ